MIYRLANNEDISELVEMARNFHQVSGLSNYGAVFNASHVRDMLSNMIANQDSLVLVAEHEYEVCGAIGAHLSHHVMNRNNGLVLELFQWVRPEARGQGVGSSLLAGLEEWAKSKGAVTVAMMSMHRVDGCAEAQFVNHGYKAVETVWYKKLG